MDDGLAGVGQYDHQYRWVYNQVIPIRRNERMIKGLNESHDLYMAQ